MFSIFSWKTRPTTITITLELFYYLSPGDPTHQHCTTSFDLDRKPVWSSDIHCLLELEKHVPQINPNSMYVITISDMEKKVPFRRLEGSLWPHIKDKFLDWNSTDEVEYATGNWTLKEVPEDARMQYYSLEEMSTRMVWVEYYTQKNNREIADLQRRR